MPDYTLTPRLQAIMQNAGEMLAEHNGRTIGAEHVMIAILDDPHAIPTQVLARFVEPSDVRDALRRLLDSDGYRRGNAAP